MKINFKRIICLIMAVAMCFVFTACGNDDKTSGENNTDGVKKLRLGCMPSTEPMVAIMKEAAKPLGYDIEIVMFDGNNLPAMACKDGDIDGLILNHLVWLNTFNKENNCDLRMVEPYYYYGTFNIYSDKYSSIEDLPQNATIAVPGDPSNMQRSLLVLEKVGLIKLGEKKDTFYSVLDIVENPKNIKLFETEITSTARSLKDVDALLSSAYFVKMQTEHDPEDVLFSDPSSKDFPIGLIVDAKDLENEKWPKELMNAVLEQKYVDKFNEEYQGAYKIYE